MLGSGVQEADGEVEELPTWMLPLANKASHQQHVLTSAEPEPAFTF
jgi:hypothetical protein